MDKFLLDMHRLCALLLLVLLSCSTAYAAGHDKSLVIIHGFDKMSCADWTASGDNSAARDEYIAWVRGVVTGYNFAVPDNQVEVSGMPGDFRLGLYIDNYCRAHQTESFTGAVFALIEERRGKREAMVISDDPKAKDTKNNDEFSAWLSHQSADIQSLDVEIQHDIFNKEMSAKADAAAK